MSIVNIPNELFNQIMSFLTDKDKINFLSTCNFYHELKTLFNYDTHIYDFEKIKLLKYKDNIIHKKHAINNIFDVVPENITQLVLAKDFYKNSFGSTFLKRISLDHKFEKDFWNKIMEKNIKHLTVDISDLICFNHIKDVSITDMIITGDFNQLIPIQQGNEYAASTWKEIIDIIPNLIINLSFQRKPNNHNDTPPGVIIIGSTHKCKLFKIPANVNTLNLLNCKTYNLDEIPFVMEISYKIC
ncbi:hypothetical protein QJ854_gp781 [Moumouvirus goulette]|uniref:F-box and FNIP repeat-containing protein n=1 Tax=Moumouvirus goulette TaxID=1247379 RepID=M1PM49_9VIRU|nr:hypothetical protein QJ854_gp781 [Moumouvirus goulette]AGF85001.1 hypothetical protein glt_00192 [Moumouvirus goulette]